MAEPVEKPPFMGSKKGPDGNWYVEYEPEKFASVLSTGEKNHFDGLKEGKTIQHSGCLFVPIEHNPHEMREDGFHPSLMGARKADDGNWYIERDGKYLRVEHGSRSKS